MNPRDIFDYKCSLCKAMWEPQYFGWNQRTGARLKTCNFCRAIRAARADVRREMRLLETVPEVPPEPVLWDAAAEMENYTEVDTEMEATAPPTAFVSYYAETATGDTDTSESQRGPDIIINLPPDSSDLETEDEYIRMNPSSSSAAVSYYCDEPEPEPSADFGTDTE